MLPNFSENLEPVDFEQLKEQLIQYIKQQQTLLVTGSIAILSKLPEALKKKPEELDVVFYKLIHRFANVSNLEDALIILTQMDEANKRIIKELEEANNNLSSTVNQRLASLVSLYAVPSPIILLGSASLSPDYDFLRGVSRIKVPLFGTAHYLLFIKCVSSLKRFCYLANK